MELVACPTFVAGVSTADFQWFAARQAQPNWCWAACIEMVLKCHGVCISQAQIVDRLFGALVDAPATLPQMLAMLSGLALHVSGRAAVLEATPHVYADSDIVGDLAAGQPLILCLSQPGLNVGHSYVLTAVRFALNPDGAARLISGVLHDPSPFSPDAVEMSWSAIAERLLALVRARVTVI